MQGHSKGMRQHLLHEPGLLFLDEPTRTQMIPGMLRRLNEDGTTIFLTTHHMEVANRLCDPGGILHHGRMAAIDRKSVV